MSKAKLEAARELIREKNFDQARVLLSTINHPTAEKWLSKLDEMALTRSNNHAQYQTDEVKQTKTAESYAGITVTDKHISWNGTTIILSQVMAVSMTITNIRSTVLGSWLFVNAIFCVVLMLLPASTLFDLWEILQTPFPIPVFVIYAPPKSDILAALIPNVLFLLNGFGIYIILMSVLDKFVKKPNDGITRFRAALWNAITGKNMFTVSILLTSKSVPLLSTIDETTATSLKDAIQKATATKES